MIKMPKRLICRKRFFTGLKNHIFIQRVNIRTAPKSNIAREGKQPVYPADPENSLLAPLFTENNMIAVYPRVVIIFDRFSQGEPAF